MDRDELDRLAELARSAASNAVDPSEPFAYTIWMRFHRLHNAFTPKVALSLIELAREALDAREALVRHGTSK